MKLSSSKLLEVQEFMTIKLITMSLSLVQVESFPQEGKAKPKSQSSIRESQEINLFLN